MDGDWSKHPPSMGPHRSLKPSSDIRRNITPSRHKATFIIRVETHNHLMRNDDAIVGYQGMSVEESLQVSHDVDRF
jgi:hypothetical protein